MIIHCNAKLKCYSTHEHLFEQKQEFVDSMCSYCLFTMDCDERKFVWKKFPNNWEFKKPFRAVINISGQAIHLQWEELKWYRQKPPNITDHPILNRLKLSYVVS